MVLVKIDNEQMEYKLLFLLCISIFPWVNDWIINELKGKAYGLLINGPIEEKILGITIFIFLERHKFE